ncbi:hypothetical protein VNI00_009206 [Paramarasmius palmivorus]|uniref:Uncharacterized protein n=1 Tax=Paramarasmius palmivorus TaxID=297713 RepID=A0AAW0CR95_9AGAR
MIPSLLALLTCLVPLVRSLDIPSTWRKPGITVLPEERKGLANAALENVIGDMQGTLGVQAAISEMDYLSNQTLNKALAGDFFSRYPTVDVLARTLKVNYSAYDALLFGYASIQAYIVYLDPQHLTAARDSWNLARNYTLLEDDITSGTRNLTLNYDHLQESCQGNTMAGGTADDVLNIISAALRSFFKRNL